MLAIHGVLLSCLGGSPDFVSVGCGRYCCCCIILLYICGTILRCGALSLSWVSLFRSRKPFFSLGGLSKKSVKCTILSSISISKSSNVLVLLGKGELDLGSVYKFLATLASHNVASCSSSLFSSSELKFLREGGVTDSIGGIFSLSELKQSGSSKYLGLYSCSVRLGQGPESEVTLLSFLLGVKISGSFGGTCFLFLTCFFHGQNFSVHLSMSSTNVWFPVWVLTFKIRRTASSGKLQVKNPFSKSHWEFSDLAIVIKNIESNIIASCLLSSFRKFSIIVISDAEIPRFWY